MTSLLLPVSHSHDRYGLRVLVMLLTLFAVMVLTSFYLVNNYYRKDFFTMAGGDHPKVYFVTTATLPRLYKKWGKEYTLYEEQMKALRARLEELGYKTGTVPVKALATLPKESLLFGMDLMALSDKESESIARFVEEGGRLIFGFTAGFLDDAFRLRPVSLVERITHLKRDTRYGSIKLPRNGGTFLTPRLLSPLTRQSSGARAFDFGVYDPVPLFTSERREPDAYMTTWTMCETVKIATDKQFLPMEKSGAVWHGSLGRGRWVYFNFPAYLLTPDDDRTRTLLAGLMRMAEEEVFAIPYPWIDAASVIFVSEDTEFKFENLGQFYEAARQHRFPVTAFCVANLAQKHPKLLKKVAADPSILEIAAHSYSHTKIVGGSDALYEKETLGARELLQRLSGQRVIGFRPPREEIDAKLLRNLEEAGYRYVLSESDNILYPLLQEEMILISRHGTDDYSYLIELDWDSRKILDQMLHEARILARLENIYTLSTHTHLLSFGPNIEIVKKFMESVRKEKGFGTPMNGRMVAQRVRQRLQLTTSVEKTPNNLVLTLTYDGDEPIENLRIRIDKPDGMTIRSVSSEMMGLEVELEGAPDRPTLRISKVKPRSRTLFFLAYDEKR